MKKQNFKNYAIILWIIAGLVIIGLSSHWTFANWQIIDWVVIITNVYIGYRLYNSKD